MILARLGRRPQLEQQARPAGEHPCWAAHLEPTTPRLLAAPLSLRLRHEGPRKTKRVGYWAHRHLQLDLFPLAALTSRRAS